MTVFRRGLHNPTQPAPVRVELGHLVVTIDDLRALMQMLAADQKLARSQIQVDFGGGYFDDPQDLRELSDAELQGLKIQAVEVEIQLGRDVAVAIGNGDMCHGVLNKWARQRQTKETPPRDGYWLVKPWKWFATAIALTAGAFVSFGLAALEIVTGPVIGPWLTALAAISLMLCAAFVLWTRFPAKSYAIIDPVTLEERRRSQVVRSRHLQTAVIALAGVVVALIAVLVTILVA